MTANRRRSTGQLRKFEIGRRLLLHSVHIPPTFTQVFTHYLIWFLTHNRATWVLTRQASYETHAQTHIHTNIYPCIEETLESQRLISPIYIILCTIRAIYTRRRRARVYVYVIHSEQFIIRQGLCYTRTNHIYYRKVYSHERYVTKT